MSNTPDLRNSLDKTTLDRRNGAIPNPSPGSQLNSTTHISIGRDNSLSIPDDKSRLDRNGKTPPNLEGSYGQKYSEIHVQYQTRGTRKIPTLLPDAYRLDRDGVTPDTAYRNTKPEDSASF